jgi:hypothetical protein
VLAVHGGLPGCYRTAGGPVVFHTGTPVHLDACMHANVAFMLVSFIVLGSWVDFHFPMRPPLPADRKTRLKAIQTSRKTKAEVEPYYILQECQCGKGACVFDCPSSTCQSRSEAFTPADRQEHPNPIFKTRLHIPSTEETLRRVQAARQNDGRGEARLQAARQRDGRGAARDPLEPERLRNALFGKGTRIWQPCQEGPARDCDDEAPPGYLQSIVQDWPDHIKTLVQSAQDAYEAFETDTKAMAALTGACSAEQFFMVDKGHQDMQSSIAKHWSASTCGTPPTKAHQVPASPPSMYGHLVRPVIAQGPAAWSLTPPCLVLVMLCP